MQLISSVVKGTENRSMVVDLRYDKQHSDQPVVIFVHGFKGFKDWGHFSKVGNELVQNGFAFVSFNFTHDGTTIEQPSDFADLEAFGNNNYNKELFDLEQVIHGISNETLFSNIDFSREQIYLLGHSRGGGVSIVKASEDMRVKGLVTWASVADLKRTQVNLDQWKKDGVVYIPNARTNQKMPMYYQFVEDYLAQEERYNVQLCCEKISVPSLFVHGTNDGTVPSSDALKLEAWSQNGEAFLIENADHVFGGNHPYSETHLPEHTDFALIATIAHFKKVR